MNTVKPIGLLFLLSCIIPAIALSQTTETYYDYKWKPCKPANARFYSKAISTDSGWYRKDYYIQEEKICMIGLYKDAGFKNQNGTFYKYFPGGTIQSIGKYVNNKKEGLWLRFARNQMLVDSTVYTNGSPIGTSMGWHTNGILSDSSVFAADGSGVTVHWYDNGNPSMAGMYAAGKKKNKKWNYYRKNGGLSETEIYNAGKLVNRIVFDEKGNQLADTSRTEKDAQFPGGTAAWGKYLSKNIYFPTQYKIVNSDKVTVIVDFVVDEDGKVQDAYVSSPFHPAFDQIALNTIRRSPKWIPAVQHNRNVRAFRRQPVSFGQR